MSKKYIHIFISWLRYIFKTTTSRSHKAFLAILRLFRRYEVVGSANAKERIFGENGLALSSQPLKQVKLPASMALAIPSQNEGSQSGTSPQLPPSGLADERSNGVDLDAQRHQEVTSPTPWSMPQPYIPADTQPQPVAPEQYPDIILTPITPSEVKRYDRIIPVYASHIDRVW